jgi:hypothetical protein
MSGSRCSFRKAEIAARNAVAPAGYSNRPLAVVEIGRRKKAAAEAAAQRCS